MKKNDKRTESKRYFKYAMIFGVFGALITLYNIFFGKTYSPAAFLIIFFAIIFYFKARKLAKTI